MPLADLAPTSAGAAARHPLLRSRRRLARYLLLGAGAAAAGYTAYCVYHSESAAAWRKQLARLRAAIAVYAEAFGTGADTLQMLLADLRSFLQSDRQEVPASLRQLARLMQSQEVSATTSATVAALLRGVSAAGGASRPGALSISSGTNSSGIDGDSGNSNGASRGALDRVLEAMLSEQGQGLVSVAVSLGARNLVTAYCEAQHRLASEDAAARSISGAAPTPDLANRLLDFLASPRGQQVAVLTVTAFVSSGMRTYLDQTMDLNVFEDLLAAMAKPEHLEAVKQCVAVFARDVVGAYLAGPSPAGDGGNGGTQGQPVAGVPTQLRLSASCQELLSSAAGTRGRPGQQQQRRGDLRELPADSGSPCGSSASGEWSRQRQLDGEAEVEPEVTACATAAPSDIDSDVFLRPSEAVVATKDGGDSTRSRDGGWAVRTPPAASEACPAAGKAAAARPMHPQLQRVQQEGVVGAAVQQQGMQREGSGNLEWISAVGKEWLNVAQHPQGRTVMVELAGTAAKEAARGMSAALAERFRMEWLLVVVFAMIMLAWLMHRMLGMLMG